MPESLPLSFHTGSGIWQNLVWSIPQLLSCFGSELGRVERNLGATIRSGRLRLLVGDDDLYDFDKTPD